MKDLINEIKNQSKKVRETTMYYEYLELHKAIKDPKLYILEEYFKSE